MHSCAGVRLDATTASAVAKAVEGMITNSLAKPLVRDLLALRLPGSCPQHALSAMPEL